jgi:hypothetical protein
VPVVESATVTTGIVLPHAPKPMPARSLVLASRMPTFGARTGPGLFDREGDVVYECGTLLNGKPCGWGCAGTRADVKNAVENHRRMYHSQDVDPVVGFLNRPRA